MLGWVVETAIPVLIVFGAAWLISNRVITTWDPPAPALFHIREYDGSSRHHAIRFSLSDLQSYVEGRCVAALSIAGHL